MGQLSAGQRGSGRGDLRCGDGDAPASLTPVSWRARVDLSCADWVEQGRKLGVIGRNAGWWIGDWLRYGNAAYGERYTRAARLTGYDVQTLMNMVYVASRVDSSRRRAELSWSHHAELAPLDPATQERWLAHAEAERLSVRCLREEVRREARALAAGSDVEVAEAAEAAAAATAGSADPGSATADSGTGSADTTAAGTGTQVVCQACGHSFTTGQHPAAAAWTPAPQLAPRGTT